MLWQCAVRVRSGCVIACRRRLHFRNNLQPGYSCRPAAWRLAGCSLVPTFHGRYCSFDVDLTGNCFDWCYDHEFVIASPIDYDHGCVPIGYRDHWRHSSTLGYDHAHRDRDHGGHPLSRRPRRHDDEDVVLTSSSSRHCRDVVTT